MNYIKTRISLLTIIFSLASSISFGQGPGAFTFHNNLTCEVSVSIWAYDGDCTSEIDCGSPVGSILGVTISAHTTTNIASGYSGSGSVWGKVAVSYGGNTTYNGITSCTAYDNIECDDAEYVQWDSCNDATIP